ncbi:MAG: hypothetical protein M4579_000870 [Chaenotheca gracillima]|nr:MAG: hypothetical protein M4579_000870 [Chaenotheca gracillima]
MGNADPEDVFEEALKHFNTIQWCRPILHDPAYTAIDTPSRRRKDDAEDSLFAETLHTPSTIKHCVSLLRTPPAPALPNIPPPPEQPFAHFHANKDRIPPADVVALLTLGSGVNGHPNFGHGGFITVLLDEFMSLLVGVHEFWGSSTVFLNTTFTRGVATPGTILVRAWLVRKEAKKLWLHGRVENEKGQVCGSADGLWVQSKPKL